MARLRASPPMLLVQAGQILADPRWQAAAERAAAEVLQRLRDEHWLEASKTPGLLIGLAGIGYGLLRLVAPEQVPCVLLLAPPALAWTSQPICYNTHN